MTDILRSLWIMAVSSTMIILALKLLPEIRGQVGLGLLLVFSCVILMLYFIRSLSNLLYEVIGRLRYKVERYIKRRKMKNEIQKS